MGVVVGVVADTILGGLTSVQRPFFVMAFTHSAREVEPAGSLETWERRLVRFWEEVWERPGRCVWERPGRDLRGT